MPIFGDRRAIWNPNATRSGTEVDAVPAPDGVISGFADFMSDISATGGRPQVESFIGHGREAFPEANVAV